MIVHITEVSPLIALAVVSTSVLIAVLLSRLSLSQYPIATSSSSKDSTYQITKCPNPNCARCSRYAELNRSAQRRLPYVATGKSLARIREAITTGPDVRAGEECHDGPDAGIDRSSPVPGQRPNVLLVRGLEARPMVTDMHLNACRIIEDIGQEAIFKEYVSAINSSVASALENDVREGTWQVMHLINQGSWVQSNFDLCPQITKAIRSIDSAMTNTIFANAFVSVLYPGTDIDPHCGPTNVRHRLHFPLSVPPPTSTSQGGEREPELRVAKERITWKEAECFVFDDSIVHSASYPAGDATKKKCANSLKKQCRVVLIVDLWHPDLTMEERQTICALYPPM